ncbi:hypothetical protein B0T10DRAFT_411076 [Thelonectria olida]|uniref:Uncharacterized protein n=1 Tax=Thelonectria olida TaxID=1576542 RepID=A0A9P8VZQ8_9HYPO|nr:hypothetical protein B0T10DRAFT_411076 [Thelonectria olida]
MNPIPAVHGLPFHHGFACTRCEFLTVNWKRLKVHCNQEHGVMGVKARSGLWSSVRLQTFFTGPRSVVRYCCVTAAGADAVPEPAEERGQSESR